MMHIRRCSSASVRSAGRRSDGAARTDMVVRRGHRPGRSGSWTSNENGGVAGSQGWGVRVDKARP
jgi:hypothetical protein